MYDKMLRLARQRWRLPLGVFGGRHHQRFTCFDCALDVNLTHELIHACAQQIMLLNWALKHEQQGESQLQATVSAKISCEESIKPLRCPFS